MRIVVSRLFSQAITSKQRRAANRSLHSLPRRWLSKPAIVHYFHDLTDPYSKLLATLLPKLVERYQIDLRCHRVLPPDAAAAPDIARLKEWSQRDAARLAAHFAIEPDRNESSSLAFMTQDPARGSQLRDRLGHYLGATLYFEGEWYWGLDRLHYLEQRLQQAGLARKPDNRFLCLPPPLQLTAQQPGTEPRVLNFYCSLRSPYTYLAAERIKQLTEHYALDLRLRFVLPMVMRGLPVPFVKRKYILLDCKREADRLGLPFGNVADPVGEPVENGLAILHAAIKLGRGAEFLLAFLRGVFVEGLDASRRDTLRLFCVRAGLDEEILQSALTDDNWRTIAADNRQQLLKLGLWGVPSFQLEGYPAVWGQDRLWMIEQDLLSTHTS